uniref:Transmembrane protein n=1 Tax=Tanacetum cinerariifolium TaxID=118510 RepID=A0A6L2P1T0_TANCI|nr:hypothetical protein [Tanacetum cinerariifolium]
MGCWDKGIGTVPAKMIPRLWILDKFELHVHLFLKILLPDPALLLVFILVLKLPSFGNGWKRYEDGGESLKNVVENGDCDGGLKECLDPWSQGGY